MYQKLITSSRVFNGESRNQRSQSLTGGLNLPLINDSEKIAMFLIA